MDSKSTVQFFWLVVTFWFHKTASANWIPFVGIRMLVISEVALYLENETKLIDCSNSVVSQKDNKKIAVFTHGAKAHTSV